MYNLRPFMDEIVREEIVKKDNGKKLKKWMGIFQVRIFWVGIFRGKFSRGEFDGLEFSGW